MGSNFLIRTGLAKIGKLEENFMKTNNGQAEYNTSQRYILRLNNSIICGFCSVVRVLVRRYR